MKVSIAGVIATLIVTAVAVNFSGSRAEEPLPNKRAEFMKLKLEYSKKVLEGLVKEDYEAITDGGRKLNRLSRAAEWEVPTIPQVQDYLRFTAEFQRAADDLVKSGKAKNLDGATLAYTRLTMNCVDCHKYVRFAAK